MVIDFIYTNERTGASIKFKLEISENTDYIPNNNKIFAISKYRNNNQTGIKKINRAYNFCVITNIKVMYQIYISTGANKNIEKINNGIKKFLANIQPLLTIVTFGHKLKISMHKKLERIHIIRIDNGTQTTPIYKDILFKLKRVVIFKIENTKTNNSRITGFLQYVKKKEYHIKTCPHPIPL
ncbi:MAG: hypothetical protein U0518_00285 [Candidatus Gracilibacteria bacterium]